MFLANGAWTACLHAEARKSEKVKQTEPVFPHSLRLGPPLDTRHSLLDTNQLLGEGAHWKTSQARSLCISEVACASV